MMEGAPPPAPAPRVAGATRGTGEEEEEEKEAAAAGEGLEARPSASVGNLRPSGFVCWSPTWHQACLPLQCVILSKIAPYCYLLSLAFKVALFSLSFAIVRERAPESHSARSVCHLRRRRP